MYKFDLNLFKLFKSFKIISLDLIFCLSFGYIESLYLRLKKYISMQNIPELFLFYRDIISQNFYFMILRELKRIKLYIKNLKKYDINNYKVIRLEYKDILLS